MGARSFYVYIIGSQMVPIIALAPILYGIIRDETRFSHPLAEDTALMEVLNSKQRTLVWHDGER